jgi:hypothetical protein
MEHNFYGKLGEPFNPGDQMSSTTMEKVPDAVLQMTQQAMTGEPARSRKRKEGFSEFCQKTIKATPG